MYKTAPRYLSGVSVFYGDDITRRNVTGEIAFFLGQANKGPSVPVVLSSIDAAVLLYGKNSPILKGLYEFWDGYIDSPKAQELQLVTLRIGGKQAVLTTPYGVTLTTSDAYTGIEDDYYVYIDAKSVNKSVKIWNKDKQKVLDTSSGINTGHVICDGVPAAQAANFGKDLDEDPYGGGYTLKTIIDPLASSVTGSHCVMSSGSITGSYNKTTDEYKLKLSIGGSGIDTSGGMITLKERSNASTKVQYLKYTSAVLSGGDYFFTIKGEVIYTPDHLERTAYVSKFDLTEGDSELTTDPRLKYEMFRNALAEIEQFTPDYIVPCGIYFNETDKFTKTTSHSTSLTKVVTEGDPVKITVDGAAIWRSTGNVDINDGTFVDQHIYTSIQEVTNDDGTVDYDVNLSSAGPFSITSVVASGDTTFNLNTPTLTGTAANAMLKKLRDSGYLKLDNNLIKYTKVAFATDDASYVTITRDITGGNAVLLSAVASGYKQIKGINSSYGTYDITHSYVESVNRELGIGYVKETDIGGSYTFEWSNELGKDKNGKASGDYNLAHFGYLLANFCSESAIGSNTPICGMNIDVTNVAASNFSRNAIVNWIGTMPSYKNVAGTDSVSQVLATGTGLLGDPVMAGSYNYNRATLADPSSGIVADPGLGLMLTSEGGIDGSLARDNFGVLVDLGKFMVVGAGLLTFSNGASITSYIDACGIYALGMLSGKPTNEGISFSRIGQTSNTTVSVVVHRKYYNDLARMKFIVPTRERGLGWVLNNGDSAARTDSQYKLISTTRIIKTIVEKKRALLSTFIGKALNQYYYEAAKTKLADSFKTDVVEGLINGFKFDLQVEDVAAAIGKLYLKIAINPPFELTQVTIDTVIDRSVTNTK